MIFDDLSIYFVESPLTFLPEIRVAAHSKLSDEFFKLSCRQQGLTLSQVQGPRINVDVLHMPQSFCLSSFFSVYPI